MSNSKRGFTAEIQNKTDLIRRLVDTLVQDIKKHEDKRLDNYMNDDINSLHHAYLNIPESKGAIKSDIVKIRRELLKLSKMFDDV